ncbi:pyridoxal phosphate-dependent aminotransferase [Candidatus Micrarchaeota archaeon]|nr:pyridoxal phosphate-dependent aminotransferase [Candidatus Micrarchaeota archaeon]
MKFYELAEKALQLEREGKEIIRLNVGDTNLSPPACAIEAVIKEIKHGKANYGSSIGMQELREKIAEREQCEVENVVIGPGSKHLIHALLSLFAKKGEVLLPTPTWPAYRLACEQLGFKYRQIKTRLEDNWNFEKLDFEKAELLILCNPGNPTSTIYEKRRVDDAIKEANEEGVTVIIDEAYKDLAFEKAPHYKGVIRVRSFSKEFNMANWRLGYAIAPEEIVNKISEFNQITITCVPSFVQKAGIACLENKKDILKENVEIWKKRSDVAQRALRKEGFRFARPQAGIYIFATHNEITDANRYVMRLLEEGIAVAPGDVFGEYNEFVRICVNRSEDVLEKAIGIMCNALD